MLILIIFLILAIIYKKEIKTIISFLFLGIVVMLLWDDLIIIALILSLVGFTAFLTLAIVALIKKDKTAKYKFLVSTLCLLIVAIGIMNDDSKSQPVEQTSRSTIESH
ncbi:hypothetical protein PWYN_23765 [Paenibacillus wynnii]|uniref:Uncharacterized protein n=1 Tax=Paenibacillus wynnii TaxID=268407 RepID=A0A098M4Y0_9BACL|nr:hypothetical protein PWYN_23765 [Paenibacillus wynnii]